MTGLAVCLLVLFTMSCLRLQRCRFIVCTKMQLVMCQIVIAWVLLGYGGRDNNGFI